MTELLKLIAVTRRYGRVAAVDRLDLAVMAGSRHAVIGPNGAGKSTLLGLIAGTVPATEGRVVFDRRDVTRADPVARSQLGISRTFQQPAVLGSLSCLDNVALAAWRHTELRGLWRPGRHRALTDRCLDYLDLVGLEGHAHHTAGELAHGQRRLLEIAAALAARPRLLLLDEPAAGLTEADTALLVGVLQQLSDEVTLLLVEHNLEFVSALADTVTVLHGGRLLAAGTPGEVSGDPAVREAYLGAD